MGDFYYFVPGVSAVNAAAIRALGLAGSLGEHYEQGTVDSGPGGAFGTMLQASGQKRPLRCDAEAQDWFPSVPKGGVPAAYWLGFETAAPPGPADLIRERVIPGADVVLADGNAWHCPTARWAAGESGLPLRVGLDAEGRRNMSVVERYAELWSMAMEVLAELAAIGGQGEQAGGMTFERALAIAAAALGANYRVGLLEVEALGLLTTDLYGDVLRALVDWAGMLDLEKKTAPAS